MHRSGEHRRQVVVDLPVVLNFLAWIRPADHDSHMAPFEYVGPQPETATSVIHRDRWQSLWDRGGEGGQLNLERWPRLAEAMAEFKHVWDGQLQVSERVRLTRQVGDTVRREGWLEPKPPGDSSLTVATVNLLLVLPNEWRYRYPGSSTVCISAFASV